MQQAAVRLARFLEARGRTVAVVWLVLVVASVPFALRQSEDLTGSGFDVPGSGSDLVRRAVEREFPAAGQAQLAVVLVAQEGAGPAALRAAAARLGRDLARVPEVRIPLGATERGLQTIATGVVVVGLTVATGEVAAPDVTSKVRDTLAVGEPRRGIVAHVIGVGAFVDATADVLEEDLAAAEAIGLPIVLVILLAAFGSLAAAVLPLALALASVTVTGALIFGLSQQLDIYLVATNLASLVGLGVAVDYSLFVLVRYREEIRSGHPPDVARARALATSGLAVAFSGATVIASLAAIWTVDSSALRSMALGAILVVAIAVLAATTLLPPLLRLLGHRAWTPGRLRTRAARHGGTRAFWSAWTDHVTRRPGLAAAASGLLLVALALPALGMDIRSSVLGQLPADHEARLGYERAASVLGPGVADEARVLVSAPDAAAAAAAVRRRLAVDPAVSSVGEPLLAGDGQSALLRLVPAHRSDTPAAKAAVERWRRELPASAGPGAAVAVGGAAAAQLDYEEQIRNSLWRILLFVLLVCYAVLVVLLRSLVVPLKAVLVNLLSVGAAYGVIVVVFQWGWLDGPLGFDSPGSVDPTVPPILLALVFGLSMDYEVFLLSRIRERFELTGDSRRAVAEGLASSAATITSAAAIMVAVFAAFMLTGIPAIQMIALGGAVAIALDATLVRLVLVPATMALLGDRNWWLPHALAQRLPASFERLDEVSAD